MTSAFIFLISSSLRKLPAAKLETGLEVVRRCSMTDGDSVVDVASLVVGVCAGLFVVLALK